MRDVDEQHHLAWERVRPTNMGRALALAALFFIAAPVSELLGDHLPAWRVVVVLSAVAVYLVVYIGAMRTRRRRGLSEKDAWVIFSVLVAIGTALTALDRPRWALLLIFPTAIAAFGLPRREGLAAIVGCAALATGAAVIGAANADTVVGAGVQTLAIGLWIWVTAKLVQVNAELAAAREEVARLAVSEERLRFARDLHDLLGHSLSLIALKAELAGRLLPDRPADAEREIADIREATRRSLVEVRDAVSGYRRPTLDTELAGAGAALSAAGIAVDVDREPAALPEDVEAVLAWAVREGSTNVLRHSGAHRVDPRSRP